MIGNARRVRSGHNQRKKYFYFGVQKRLRAFLNPIFTGGATLSVTPYGVPAPPKGELLGCARNFPPCQRLPPRGSWQNRQVLTEGVKLPLSGELASRSDD